MHLNTCQARKTRTRRILVIEDHEDGRESLQILLQLYGYRVETAADGIEGVEKALTSHPEVVLIDIGLPGLDGYQVARKLRAALGDRVLLIAQTAYSAPEERERGRAAGFDAWLVKPLNPEELSHWLLVAALRAHVD